MHGKKATADGECLRNELVPSKTWQTKGIMNKLFSCAVAIVLSIGFYSVGNAQHCPPIVESYLSDSKVKRTEGGLQFKFVNRLRINGFEAGRSTGNLNSKEELGETMTAPCNCFLSLMESGRRHRMSSVGLY